MDIIPQLFSYIPEKWRPYVAFLLLVLYVGTKIRSEGKSQEIKSLKNIPPAENRLWTTIKKPFKFIKTILLALLSLAFPNKTACLETYPNKGIKEAASRPAKGIKKIISKPINTVIETVL